MKKILVLLGLIFSSSFALAVPNSINYQGRLLDTNGVPVNDTLVFTVSLWDALTGGTQQYSETHNVTITDGVYSLDIGNGVPPISGSFDPSLFTSGNSIYLQVIVDGETLTPRSALRSTPFTFQSSNSDALEGNPASHFATAASLAETETKLKDFCLAMGGTWSSATGCSNLPSTSQSTLAVLVHPETGKYVPLTRPELFLAGPDQCPRPHYHDGGASTTDCDGTVVTDPNPSACGYGQDVDVITITSANCLNP